MNCSIHPNNTSHRVSCSVTRPQVGPAATIPLSHGWTSGLVPGVAKMSARSLVVTVEAAPVGLSVKKATGAELVAVAAGSQGEKLGLAPGMKVLKISGKAVASSTDVTKALAAGKAGGKPYKIELEVAVPGTEAAAPPASAAEQEQEQQQEQTQEEEGSAVSAKEATADGHKVTTLVSGTSAKAEAPAEPAPATAEAEEEAAAAAAAVPADPKASAATAAAAAASAAAAETAAVASAAAAAEAAELLRRQDGSVTLKYEMYAEQFAIAGGSTTAAAVDAEYCLSFVMPKCRIHLSALEGRALTARMVEEQQERYAYYVHEEDVPMPPPDEDGEVPAIACNAAYHGLLDGNTYYVYITEDSEEEAKMMAKAKAIWAQAELGVETSGGAAERRPEGCSCIEGNPCANEYICKDWYNRFAVAKKHGWKEAVG